MKIGFSYTQLTLHAQTCHVSQKKPTQAGMETNNHLTLILFPLSQFFFFMLITFAIEVAAGIWGFSNQTKVT